MARNLSRPYDYGTVHDITKDMTDFSAGNSVSLSDKMEDESHEPELAKTAHANTPTKPRAVVGQPDTPSTANKKKTRATIFVTSAQADADKTAAQRSAVRTHARAERDPNKTHEREHPRTAYRKCMYYGATDCTSMVALKPITTFVQTR